jgi:hypothetical protein
MIRVTPAKEPDSFNAAVRAPGQQYLHSLPNIDDADASRHPYWRKQLRELHTAYGGICAYTSHWMPYDVGNDTVEHFQPKSQFPALAYEWTNYRLVCGRMNGRKGSWTDVVDPFEVVPGMFYLDFPSLLVVPGDQLGDDQKELAQNTIARLRLNESRSTDMRQHFIQNFMDGHISGEYLQKHAPFLHSELHRLNLDHDALETLFENRSE